MAESKLPRGVIVEFDYAVVDGSALLYDLAQRKAADQGIKLTPILEAKHLAANGFQAGFVDLFQAYGKDKDTAIESARTVMGEFEDAINASCATAFTDDFKAFVKVLADKGVKVALFSRANVETLRAAVAEAGLEGMVSVTQESTSAYSHYKWDAWKRVLNANDFIDVLSVGITSSGFGVKQALISGIAALAIERPRNAYQDFGGADNVVSKLDAAAAEDVLHILKCQ